MKISVVIPVYNEEKYIAKTLESLLAQDTPAYEIIVVNNNSTDNSASVISKYPVTMITETKQGIIHARNAGFNYATGDIIARTDADAIVPKNWLTKINENFNENIDALAGPIIYYDLSKDSLIGKVYSNSEIYFAVARFLQHGKETLLGPNMAIRRELWDRVKEIACQDDHAVHEDIDLAIHILKLKAVIKHDPTLLVETSARRILYNPSSFFIEYHWRLLKTLYHKYALDLQR